MSRIVVIAGSDSPEREVSLRSGAAIVEALLAGGHAAKLYDIVGKTMPQNFVERYDVAFPIVHGGIGESGELQEVLDGIGLKYVGSGVQACELTFDKSAYKHLLAAEGLPVPKGASVHGADLDHHELFQRPFVLKPNEGGSSVDTFIVRDAANAPWEDIKEALERYREMLLEELIEGVEITVGVLGSEALPVIEIIPPTDGEFDYENKYNGATQELCPPEHVADAVQQAARELAVQIHQLTGCRDFSRTDMIVRADGSLVVLETNTLPGMTDQSLFPKMAAQNGMPMSELCDRLVQMALSR